MKSDYLQYYLVFSVLELSISMGVVDTITRAVVVVHLFSEKSQNCV